MPFFIRIGLSHVLCTTASETVSDTPCSSLTATSSTQGCVSVVCQKLLCCFALSCCAGGGHRPAILHVIANSLQLLLSQLKPLLSAVSKPSNMSNCNIECWYSWQQQVSAKSWSCSWQRSPCLWCQLFCSMVGHNPNKSLISSSSMLPWHRPHADIRGTFPPCRPGLVDLPCTICQSGAA